jgi:hypothetical protein
MRTLVDRVLEKNKLEESRKSDNKLMWEAKVATKADELYDGMKELNQIMSRAYSEHVDSEEKFHKIYKDFVDWRDDFKKLTGR